MGEVEVRHRVDGHDVDVGVGHLETGDHQAHPGGGEGLLLGPADGVGDLHEVGGQVDGEVDPVVDLDAGDDQHVAPVQGTDVGERHTRLVGPHETGRDLPGDDAGEDAAHTGIVECRP